MKKNSLIITVCAVCCIHFFSACSLNLEPAWKNTEGKASLSIQFATLNPANIVTSERAVMGGNGFLYIRTVGGPTGDKGPYYGPYPIGEGQKFETTDIPAGTYAGIGFLHAAYNLENKAGFVELMKLSDTEFNANTDGSGGSSPFDAILDGDASGYYMKNVTIEEGVINTLSMTLSPITGSTTTWNMSSYIDGTPIPLPSTNNLWVKKFFKLINISSPAGTQNTSVEVSCDFSDGSVVRQVAVYNGLGNQIVVTKSTTIKYTFSYTGENEMYMYVEYNASALTLSFKGGSSGVPTNFAISISGATVYSGKTVGFALFSTCPPSPGTNPDIGGGFMIDASGNGFGYAMNVTSGTGPIAPGTYCLFAFIDANNSGSTGGPGPDDMVLTGDTAPGFLQVTVTTTDTVKSLTLTAFTRYSPPLPPGIPYYVSQVAKGSFTGLTLADSCTFEEALTKIAANSLITTSNPGVILLTESISHTTAGGYSINKPVIITSYDGSYTINLAYNLSGSFITLNDTTGPVTLSLQNVTIRGESSFNAGLGLITVNPNCILTMGPGSTLTNNVAMSNGGGVQVNGGSFIMNGGSIFGCSTSGNGGGVYVNTGLCIMNSGIISGNNATNGGGIYLTSGSLNLIGGSITSNTATTSGGGLFCSSTNLVSFNGVIVSDVTVISGTGKIITANTSDDVVGL